MPAVLPLMRRACFRCAVFVSKLEACIVDNERRSPPAVAAVGHTTSAVSHILFSPLRSCATNPACSDFLYIDFVVVAHSVPFRIVVLVFLMIVQMNMHLEKHRGLRFTVA